jgi:uncharacterized protein
MTIPMAATPGQLKQLKAFLADPARPEGTLRYHELQGFLFAVASAPDMVPPSEWMRVVFGGEEAEYASLDEAKAILGALMALYNDVNSAVFAGVPALPPDCAFRSDVLANLEDDAPISQWARGFTTGHQWLEESWEGCIPDDLDEEFGAALMTLSFFVSRKLAEEFHGQTDGRTNLEGFATTIRRLFPDALGGYARLGRAIQQVLREREHEPAAAPARAKAGRNDPCPCGSGRKYKKCCGAG